MKIGLVSAEMKINNFIFTNNQIEKYILYGIENKMDFLIFPVYVDFSIEEWKKNEI